MNIDGEAQDQPLTRSNRPRDQQAAFSRINQISDPEESSDDEQNHEQNLRRTRLQTHQQGPQRQTSQRQSLQQESFDNDESSEEEDDDDGSSRSSSESELDMDAIEDYNSKAVASFCSKSSRLPSQPKEIDIPAKLSANLGNIVAPKCMNKPKGKKKDEHAKCRAALTEESEKRETALKSLGSLFVSHEAKWVAYGHKVEDENARLTTCLAESNKSGTELRGNVTKLLKECKDKDEAHDKALAKKDERHKKAFKKKDEDHSEVLESKQKAHDNALKKEEELYQSTKDELDKATETIKELKKELKKEKDATKKLTEANQKLQEKLDGCSSTKNSSSSSSVEAYVQKKLIDAHFDAQKKSNDIELSGLKEQKKMEHKKARRDQVAGMMGVMGSMGMLNNGQFNASAMRVQTMLDSYPNPMLNNNSYQMQPPHQPNQMFNNNSYQPQPPPPNNYHHNGNFQSQPMQSNNAYQNQYHPSNNHQANHHYNQQQQPPPNNYQQHNNTYNNQQQQPPPNNYQQHNNAYGNQQAPVNYQPNNAYGNHQTLPNNYGPSNNGNYQQPTANVHNSHVQNLNTDEHNATGTAMHFGNQDFGGLGPNDAPANMNNGGLDPSFNQYEMPSVTNTTPFDQRDGFRLDTYQSINQSINQSRPFKKRPIDA
ncbi:hypothetical protein ACHAWO_006309 [Cyclotella atomus]|uniref:Uncharacterized protein n=1 Tax=Cyclotella atomus TaxID=382360 RepID=A0ABD3NB14_9STRA